MSFLKKFVPKSVKFFDLLAELSDNILKGAELMQQMITKWDNLAEYSSEIHLLEHRCDELTHRIVSELNETFITPIDREDIHSFVNSLDNIIDCIDVIANRIHLYKVKNQIEFGTQMTDILNLQMRIISDVVRNFEEDKNVRDKLVAIRNYETQGDVIFQKALAHLFEYENDVVELIKKKEILELMEKAIDRCQTVAIVIEGIQIKNQ
jgi:predicted phosphate transport protein (TIGR00153 family)